MDRTVTSMASTSLKAYRAITSGTATLRDQVLDIIEMCGPDGCIGDDVLGVFPDEMKNGTLYGRYKELEEEGVIFRSGDTRLGTAGKAQMIMRHSKYRSGPHVPVIRKKIKNPFLDGLVHAAKLIVAADPKFKGSPAAMALKIEILKIARR